jgi:hypothetical protein
LAEYVRIVFPGILALFLFVFAFWFLVGFGLDAGIVSGSYPHLRRARIQGIVPGSIALFFLQLFNRVLYFL